MRKVSQWKTRVSHFLLCFMVMIVEGALAWEIEAKTALFVVGSPALDANDSAIKARLDFYYTVTVLDDSAPADTTKDLIVISASVDPAFVGTKHKAAPKGVMVLKPELFDDMAMTATGAFGTTATQTEVELNNSLHQMAGGFSRGALVNVYSAYGSGEPA